MNCPNCLQQTHMRDRGWVRGRHMFLCSDCKNWSEEVSLLRPISKKDKQLLQSLNESEGEIK